jgi:SAM-dependent methyltransferase
MIDRSVEYEKMARVEKELWWYRVLHELTHSAIRKQFGSDTSISILDLGCGTGGLMMYLRELGYNNIQGFDLSDDAVRICKDRGLNVTKGNMLDVNTLVETLSIDVIVSNDTLCYLMLNDVPLQLSSLQKVLKPNGLLVFNLPAMKIFRGTHDIGVGIVTRFESGDVAQILSGTEMELLTKRFWPFTVAPLIYLIRLKQRWQMKRLPNTPIESDVEMPNRVINRILEALVKFECKVVGSGLFGSSLFVAARKKDTQP